MALTRAEISTRWRQRCRARGLTSQGKPWTYAPRHGLSYTPEYRAWVGMKARCLNPRNTHYRNYGGRGITVCAAWRDSFVTFLEHVGPRQSEGHELDRIDNERGYEPGNVRWVTPAENLRNRRISRRLIVRGERLALVDAATRYGVHVNTLRYRLAHGWTPERALGLEEPCIGVQ